MAALADLLTVDCGNSTIDCLRHGDGVRARFDVATTTTAELQQFAPSTITRCAAVGVAPRGLGLPREALAGRRVSVLMAGEQLRCPLPLAYDTPATLGADRWVGAFAAHHEHGRAVVVDCGSATTVNLVDADGTFRGGAIAPGLRAFAAGMAAVTPALPAPNFDALPAWPPRTTQAAVDTGVIVGWCGMVERLVAAAIAASSGPTTVVVTGGHGERLLAHGRVRGLLVADLVHRGLRLLAADASWNS